MGLRYSSILLGRDCVFGLQDAETKALMEMDALGRSAFEIDITPSCFEGIRDDVFGGDSVRRLATTIIVNGAAKTIDDCYDPIWIGDKVVGIMAWGRLVVVPSEVEMASATRSLAHIEELLAEPPAAQRSVSRSRAIRLAARESARRARREQLLRFLGTNQEIRERA